MTEGANVFEGPALDPASIGNEGFATGFAFGKNISPREVTGGKGLLGAVEEIVAAAMRGLEDAAHDVLDAAKEQAPLLEPESMKRAGRVGGNQGGVPGELIESGRVDMIEAENKAAISFNTIYASLQHEHMDWSHTHGNAKYLEKPMLETRPAQIETIAKAIREVTGG